MLKEAALLRVGTYNVLGFQGYPEAVAAAHFSGPEDPRRIDHFMQVFNELDCDIIGVQEAGPTGMLQKLGEALKQHVALYPSVTIYSGGLISRYPILETRSFNDSNARGGPFSRFAGASLVDIKGEPTWIINLHAYPHDQTVRENEARLLGEKAEQLLRANPRLIVLGDFNSRVGEVLHQALTTRGFANTHEIKSKNGVPSIDHIYVSPSLKDRVMEGRVVRDPGFSLNGVSSPDAWVHSDHVPTVVNLAWQ